MFLQPFLYAVQTIQTSKYIRDFKAKIHLELSIYIFNHSTLFCLALDSGSVMQAMKCTSAFGWITIPQQTACLDV